jgi:MFS superfamily sulfate permease-like transporter
VASGLVVGFVVILYHNYKTSYFLDSKEDEGQVVRLKLSEHATFLNKANILETFEKMKSGTKVEIDLSNCEDIDYDISEAILDFEIAAPDRNITVVLINREKLFNVISTGHKKA